MDVVDLMEQQLVAAAQNDLLAGIASGEIDTDAEPGRLKARNAKKPRDEAFFGIAGMVGCGGLNAQRLVKSAALKRFEPTTLAPATSNTLKLLISGIGRFMEPKLVRIGIFFAVI